MPDAVIVLVVEDDPLIQPLLEEMLEEGGYTTAIAATPADAIEMLEAEDAHFSALVSDVNLGKPLTGWDVAKRAREINADLPVVYTTGFADNEWASQGVPNSILLAKPFVTAQLLTAVSQLVNAARITSG